MNNLFLSGNQFLLDTEYQDYSELKPFMVQNPNTEYSKETSAFNANQYPIWRDNELADRINHKPFDLTDILTSEEWLDQINKIAKWTKKKLYQNSIYDDIAPAVCWMMEYNEGGWQSLHTHGKQSITQVIYTDAIASDNQDGKGFLSGAFYAILTDGKPSVYKALLPVPGKCIIATGDVLHGVYPVKTVPRKCLIIDYVKL